MCKQRRKAAGQRIRVRKSGEESNFFGSAGTRKLRKEGMEGKYGKQAAILACLGISRDAGQ